MIVSAARTPKGGDLPSVVYRYCGNDKNVGIGRNKVVEITHALIGCPKEGVIP